MMKKEHYSSNSKSWLVPFAIMLVMSVAVIIFTEVINNVANRKYNEPAQISFEIVSTRERDIADLNVVPYGVTRVLEAYDNKSRLVAYIVESKTVGYNKESPILMSTIISADASLVCGISILSQEETEYLGVRIAGEDFRSQFEGRVLPVLSENSTQRGSKIDLIANSTISSQAVIDGVNNVQAFVKANFLSANVNEK